MGIIAWLRQWRLQRRKEVQVRRLFEIRTSLQKIKRREPLMRSMIEPELVRLRELRKQLTKVKSEKELRFWLSLFDMCVPVFEALLNASKAPANVRRAKKSSKK